MNHLNKECSFCTKHALNEFLEGIDVAWVKPGGGVPCPSKLPWPPHVLSTSFGKFQSEVCSGILIARKEQRWNLVIIELGV
jgi:hypothetical protein